LTTSHYQTYTFSNGIRLVHRQISNPVAHFGLVVNAGSRDELPNEQGLAHFIEHMVFKGTRKRTYSQVINRLEDVGADLNAFTTKEETCIYASFLSRHYRRANELLSDILFESTFPEKEMLKEKAVIMDEINSYKDNPAEWIHDEFDEIVFPGHPLGRNIMGTPVQLRKYKQKDLVAFVDRMYLTDQVVLSSVGNLPFHKVKEITELFFGSRPQKTGQLNRMVPQDYTSQLVNKKFGKHQAHVVIGNLTYDYHDERRIPMALLNNIIGGPAMNSRLNLALRERNGIAYNVESNYQPLSDTGLFSIYLGTEEKMLDKAIQLVNKELSKLKESRLSKLQLTKAKEQLKGQLAISVESHQNEMITNAKSYLVYNRIDTIEEMSRKIDRINADLLYEVANEVLDEAKMSMLIYRNQH
jgi:predicted Zn-dependent peptidase